jgi:hypothetical protein
MKILVLPSGDSQRNARCHAESNFVINHIKVQIPTADHIYGKKNAVRLHDGQW